ncbi:B-cell receptor CD22-like isoform X2 [Denticeps clupeoides]|nr:B-cell receptor CD22-like isoform X2 [Denticeps clupeoides]
MKIKSAASPSVIFTAALITLIIPGGVGQTWGVWYRPTSICAVEGTSAVMSCNYTYPPGLRVKEAFWTEHVQAPWDGKTDYTDLSQHPNYKDRVHADCGDKTSWCFLNITRLNKSDAHEYNCRIITHKEGEKWVGRPGIMLSVTDLKVEIVGAATEGNDVRLVCKTSCNLSSSPTYSWKKNGEPLEKEPTKNNELLLHPVSREDGGRYSCAVKGHEDLSSAEVDLDVRYLPKNTRVLGAPPAEIPEGGSVTLSCSSDANPPVQNYTWFKENVTSPVAAGQNFTITNFTSAQVGLYSCQARNEVGVQNSTAVLLTFTAHKPASPTSPTWILYAVITVAAAVGLSCLITVCFLWYRKEKKDDTETILPDLQRDASKTNSIHSAADNQEDVQYASINVQTLNKNRAAAAAAAEDDVQYASINTNRAASDSSAEESVQNSGQTGGDPEEDVQYATVHFRPATHTISPVQAEAESPVIYSTVHN